ncbi:Planctomycete cytochrome C [Rubripirellula lacrimiformis]|uniref:Planctomycete cytochrome C n=1 Tax=Rubripirellula lacrimiformis TaxID=1930273 RepID=A0A517NEW0_9BACT|nr:DUF1553 domain-containing protein [Rubripirellula lacrimiformis]QDT05671.1 Planctomycete cytochrome C [Rubripirellula lacrimiformis]
MSAQDLAFFESKIRPVLVERCYDCHSAGAESIGGNLLLDSPEGISQGGHSGPALVAAKPDESLIIQAIRYHDVEMPPDDPLNEAIVNDFVRWVQRGGQFPKSNEPAGQAGAAPMDRDALYDRQALWSFLPRRDVPVPKVDDASWPRDPLDQFVLARIEAAEVAPARDADPATFVRRLYVDLVGLQPIAEEIEKFVADCQIDQPKAVQRIVDRLLASPQFGERWGRHWLDVARYAESNGDDGLGRNASFPHAWRYRDYVIDAINRDVPYDRFITEQIAGDLLPAESADQRNRQLVATGFLAVGAKPAAAMNNLFPMDVVDDQINTVCTTVMGVSVACARCHDHKHDPIPTADYYALAGIFTSTETLYGLAANEKLTAPPTPLHELKSTWDESLRDGPIKASTDFPANYSESIDQLRPLLHAKLDVPPRDLTVVGDVAYSTQDHMRVKNADLRGSLTTANDSYSVAFWFKNETGNLDRPITAYLFSRAKLDDKQLPGDHLGIGGKHDPSRSGKLFVSNGKIGKTSIAGTTVIAPETWNHVVMIRSQNRVKVFLNGQLKPEIDDEIPVTFADSTGYCLANRSDKFAPLVGNLAECAIFERSLTDDEAHRLHSASGQPRGADPQPVVLAMGARDKAKPADCQIHINGGAKKGAVVPRGFLTAYRRLSDGQDTAEFAAAEYSVGANESGRRELAAWLTHRDHPQTARVMVNRIWLHLFGQGIVATPDDFGLFGARPTHPDLLDHLANRFADGWSVKQLIRDIVLSRTYQLDSEVSQRVFEAYPANRLLARHNRRRLDAESLRDSMLQASGQIDLNPGQGSSVEKVVALINQPAGNATTLHRDSNHRSIYLCMLRHAPPPELAAFDLPDAVSIAGQRNETTLPTQSLYLLNSPFLVAQSNALAVALVGGVHREAVSDAARVTKAFRSVLRRSPTVDEQQRALKHIQAMDDQLKPAVVDAHQRREMSWASLCQALLSCNEFRYID